MNRDLLAILRGLRPNEAVEIGAALIKAGITKIEVPLNSPYPLKSIELLVHEFGEVAQLGAGTVLSVQQVEEVGATGADLIVSPNCDREVIEATKELKMLSFPGVQTSSECFEALKYGANGLKVFPAFQMGVAGLKAVRAVLPPSTQMLMVGGVEPESFASWLRAGANGFGLGSSLYSPGMSAREVGVRAGMIVEAYDEALAKQGSPGNAG